VTGRAPAGAGAGAARGAAAPRAMVLCAGLGTRLGPLSALLPKPLIPLLNIPAAVYNLRLLRAAGLREVVLNAYHKAEQLEAALGDGADLGLELRYSREDRLLGTGGGVRRMLPWLRETGTFLLLNGDTVAEVDLAAALHRHRARGAAATLLLHRHPEAARYGALRLDEQGRVSALAALLGPPPVDSDLLFAGLHILEAPLVERLPLDEPSCILRQGYVPALRAGDAIFGDPSVQFWADLGTPARYLAAQRDLLARPTLLAHAPRPRSAPAPPGLRLHPPVHLGPGLVLEGPAELGPNVVVGAGAQVAAGARLANGLVWPGARVEGERSAGIWAPGGLWVSA